MYERPTEIKGGVPDKYKSGEKTELIPTNTPGEWMQIDYTDLSFGVKVWEDVGSEVSHLEHKLEKSKRKGSASKIVTAMELEQLHHKSMLRKMKISINGEKVDVTFWDLNCNHTMFHLIQVWLNCKIDNEPFPDPDWLKELEETDDHEPEKDPITP